MCLIVIISHLADLLTSRAQLMRLRPIWIWVSVFWGSWGLIRDARNLKKCKFLHLVFHIKLGLFSLAPDLRSGSSISLPK
jgi:hypothetical protein